MDEVGSVVSGALWWTVDMICSCSSFSHFFFKDVDAIQRTLRCKNKINQLSTLPSQRRQMKENVCNKQCEKYFRKHFVENSGSLFNFASCNYSTY